MVGERAPRREQREKGKGVFEIGEFPRLRCPNVGGGEKVEGSGVVVKVKLSKSKLLNVGRVRFPHDTTFSSLLFTNLFFFFSSTSSFLSLACSYLL